MPHLPAAGEMVLFDRSWYNRAGVERVMGFCTDEEYQEFMRSCPEFERMLVRSGIILIKYWFSVSDEEQERRFQGRIKDPTKRWKLSPMDLESRKRWALYSQAKDEMFAHTDIKQAPWYVVDADVKKRARLNCISHLLVIPYEDVTRPPRVAARETRRLRATPPLRPDVRAGNVLGRGCWLGLVSEAARYPLPATRRTLPTSWGTASSARLWVAQRRQTAGSGGGKRRPEGLLPHSPAIARRVTTRRRGGVGSHRPGRPGRRCGSGPSGVRRR